MTKTSVLSAEQEKERSETMEETMKNKRGNTNNTILLNHKKVKARKSEIMLVQVGEIGLTLVEETDPPVEEGMQ